MPKVRFEPDGIEIDVPVGTSILEASNKAHAQVGSACGGVCACSTCHVYVKVGLDALAAASEREEDIMDKAFDVRATSRLGCQARILRETDVAVEISRESRQAFLDEHPDLRAKLKEADAKAKDAKDAKEAKDAEDAQRSSEAPAPPPQTSSGATGR